MKTIIKNIFWLFKPYWKYGKVFVTAYFFFWIVMVPASRLITTYSPQIIVNILEAGNPFGDVIKTAVLLVGLGQIPSIFEDIFNHKYKFHTQARIETEIKREVYVQALKTDYKYIDNPGYYDNYMWAVDNYAKKSNESHDLIQRFFSVVTVISALVAVIASIGPWVIPITVTSMILRTCIINEVNKRDLKKDEDIIPHERRLGYFHRLFYMNNYAADLKSTNLKKYILNMYDKTKSDKVNIIRKCYDKVTYLAVAHDIVYSAGSLITIIYIAHGIYTGNISQIGAYMTVFLAVDKLDGSLYEFFDLIRDGGKLSLYAGRIRKFFDINSEIEIREDGVSPADGAFSVELKNLSFSYENSDFGLKNLNLKINEGEKIAVVGENGAGKSTLVKLLLRLYDVNSGDILINGISVKDYNIHLLRKHIGVAFQSPNIYALPFIDNIELYNTADEEKLNSVINAFGLDRVLAKNGADLSSELTKEFSENGIMLSGGEAQKIGLARLMIGNFGLLLLDEPSSALDPIAEYEMNKLILDSGNRSTTIMVAHRLSTIRDADRIILVECGTIKEMGTHDDLMSQRGRYYEMFTKQAENYVR